MLNPEYLPLVPLAETSAYDTRAIDFARSNSLPATALSLAVAA